MQFHKDFGLILQCSVSFLFFSLSCNQASTKGLSASFLLPWVMMHHILCCPMTTRYEICSAEKNKIKKIIVKFQDKIQVLTKSLSFPVFLIFQNTDTVSRISMTLVMEFCGRELKKEQIFAKKSVNNKYFFDLTFTDFAHAPC